MKFRLGVNYWPARSAMYWWKRFDRSEVEWDFARIAAAGFDCVRVFLLWEDFQPRPNSVSENALDNLATVADIAESTTLSLVPTLFTGHMSGVNWIPEWAVDRARASGEKSRFRVVSRGRVVDGVPKNWYTDEAVLDAQLLLARRVATRLHDQRAVWAYDLGNENSNCVVPPSTEAANRWLEGVATEIRSADHSRAITVGLHMEDLEEDRKLGPAEAARVSDFLCMHGYPMYSQWAESPTDVMILPYLGLITRWLASSAIAEDASNIDIFFEEFGAATVPNQNGFRETLAAGVPMLGEDEAARFTGVALDSLREFGFLGAMIWCYSDYARPMWSEAPLDLPSHERSFGLWRSDQSRKPALDEIKRISGADRGPWRDDFGWIDIEASDYYRNPKENLRDLYRRFRELWS